MSLSAIPSTPVNSYPTAPISAPSPASSTSNSPPTSGTPDRPNDGDADDKSSVPTAPATQSSSAVQTALTSLKLGG